MPESPAPTFAGARRAMIDLCAEMERLLGGTSDSQSPAGDIHAIRKAGKRLRGALVLADEPKPCIRWIAVVGSMLGESRDAAARLKTWGELLPESSEAGTAESAAAALLAQEAEAANRRPPQEVTGWALSALEQIRGRLEARTDEEVADAAAAGAEILVQRLRKRLKRALQRASNEDFHECRKAAKAWLGGMSLACPDAALPGSEEANRLADALGEENDLEVLAIWLDARGFSRSICPALWKTLRKRQEKVRRRSISLIRKEVLPALKQGA